MTIDYTNTFGSTNCALDYSFYLGGGGQTSIGCTSQWQAYACYSVPDPDTLNGFSVNTLLYSSTRCGGSVGYSYYSMPSTCGNYANHGADTRNAALTNIRNTLAGEGYATTINESVYLIGSTQCTDQYGNVIASGNRLPGEYFYQSQDAGGNRLAYDITYVRDVQDYRLASSIPAGYIQEATSVCATPTVLSINLANQSAQLACAANAHDVWAWTVSEQNSLKINLADRWLATAYVITNGTPGVVANSVNITTSPRGATKMPGASGIALTIGG